MIFIFLATSMKRSMRNARTCQEEATTILIISIELERISKEFSALFFDSATVTDSSAIDGIHLDVNQHL
jgi:hypothetical protein